MLGVFGVNGKRMTILNWLNTHISDQAIIFLQETHSKRSDENSWITQFGCENIFYSHGQRNARGVLLIGVRKNLALKLEDIRSNDEGRFPILKCIIQDTPFLLVNIYNANYEHEQVKVLQTIKSLIYELDEEHDYKVIAGGDFNFIQDTVLDSDGGSLPWTPPPLPNLLSCKTQGISLTYGESGIHTQEDLRLGREHPWFSDV